MKKLKKSQIFAIVTCGLAALLLTFVLMVGLRSEGFGAGESGAAHTHLNSQELDPEELDLDSLEIRWLTGPVTVGASPDGKIHVTERSNKALDEGSKMDVSVKSGKLSVRWDGQWFRQWFNVNLGWFGHLDKELEVLLPPGLAGDLSELEVGNTSGSLRVSGYSAEEMDISTVSGALELAACRAETKLSVESVSGDVTLTGTVCEEDVDISTVSGAIEVDGGSGREVHIKTVSGGCQYAGTAHQLRMSTVSGELLAALNSSPEEAELASVSGGLRLNLPEGSGFTVNFSSVSGEFTTDFPVERNGGKSGAARSGSGTSEIAMSTTSGGMKIGYTGRK